MGLSIETIKQKIENIIKKYSIKKVMLFGSYADNTATDESDIDFLVEFDKPEVSLFVISSLKYELEELLEKSVDVIHAPLPKETYLEIDKVVELYAW